MFLDEPTSGLDPVASRDVHDLIASLRERGVTVFLTTHRLEEAERLCDRVAHSQHPAARRRAAGASSGCSCSAAHWWWETAVRLPAPETVFTRDMGVDKWITEGDATYVLTVCWTRG